MATNPSSSTRRWIAQVVAGWLVGAGLVAAAATAAPGAAGTVSMTVRWRPHPADAPGEWSTSLAKSLHALESRLGPLYSRRELHDLVDELRRGVLMVRQGEADSLSWLAPERLSVLCIQDTCSSL